MNDGAGSVFSKMPGATLDVTGVPVTNVVGLFTTGVHASSITVTDRLRRAILPVTWMAQVPRC